MVENVLHCDFVVCINDKDCIGLEYGKIYKVLEVGEFYNDGICTLRLDMKNSGNSGYFYANRFKGLESL